MLAFERAAVWAFRPLSSEDVELRWRQASSPLRVRQTDLEAFGLFGFAPATCRREKDSSGSEQSSGSSSEHDESSGHGCEFSSGLALLRSTLDIPERMFWDTGGLCLPACQTLRPTVMGRWRKEHDHF